MSFIEEVDKKDAKGLLKEVYDEIIENMGRLPSVLSVMSLNPEVLKGLRHVNKSIRSSTLGKRKEEIISTYISRLNDCHY